MTFVERGRNSIYFSFSDVEKDSKSFVSNVSQEEERQKVMAFLEKYRAGMQSARQ